MVAGTPPVPALAARVHGGSDRGRHEDEGCARFLPVQARRHLAGESQVRVERDVQTVCSTNAGRARA